MLRCTYTSYKSLQGKVHHLIITVLMRILQHVMQVEIDNEFNWSEKNLQTNQRLVLEYIGWMSLHKRVAEILLFLIWETFRYSLNVFIAFPVNNTSFYLYKHAMFRREKFLPKDTFPPALSQRGIRFNKVRVSNKLSATDDVTSSAALDDIECISLPWMIHVAFNALCRFSY